MLRSSREERASCESEQEERVTFSSIIAALSFALDLTEGAQAGHALRTCLLGMKIGKEIGLAQEALCDLYYALLLKDVGCSSNATRLCQIVGGDERRAKHLTKTTDWTRVEWKQIHFLLRHVHARDKAGSRVKAIGSMLKHSSENAQMLIRLRCEQGASVVRDLGLGEGTAEAIHNLDEHWNGAGYPDHLAGEGIPLLARILSISQTLDVFHTQYGPAAALDVVQRRSGRWFDPALVRAVVCLSRKGLLWVGIESARLKEDVAELEPNSRVVMAEPAAIDNICGAFAGVVDAKSHSTYMHSTEVARIAVEIGDVLGLPAAEITVLRRAGLLHDIGKLSVPNSILDKPGKLTPAEWECVKQHPRYTFEILSRVPTFQEIAGVAATHHEKLDGSGYYRGLKSDELSQLCRVLTVADMYEALTAERPYRNNLSCDEVLAILRKDVPLAIDADCFRALVSIVERQRGGLSPVETAAAATI